MSKKLPQLLARKLYKIGQTRGAEDDVIYQNRVSRTSTVLIPFSYWEQCRCPEDGTAEYENGFIVLISPSEYFETSDIDRILNDAGLQIGVNALVFYERRRDWTAHNPDKMNWKPAQRRTNPLGGEYVARIAATTASSDGAKINLGFTTTAMKGAGIRVYEYANRKTIEETRLQLEVLYWLCKDSLEVAVANGMSLEGAHSRKNDLLTECDERRLLDRQILKASRLVNSHGTTICPLCLEEVSARGFFNRMAQAEGRDVHDLTVTELNLFHVQELRTGKLYHKPYNLGWGHHHCNVVVKDSGILQTLEWMREVIARNSA